MVSQAPGLAHAVLQMQQVQGNRYVRAALESVHVAGVDVQTSRLRDFKSSAPAQSLTKPTNAEIEATNEYRAYMDPSLVWQTQLHLTREEALLACQMILMDMRKGMSIPWQRDARIYALKARHQLGTSTSTSVKGDTAAATTAKKVPTLCYRNFQAAIVPGKAAQHCFVWGHAASVKAVPENIKEGDPDTATFDDQKGSGRPDPMPRNNTTCSRTYPDIDFEVVRKKYVELCDPKLYNLVSFNCCTCAYLALSMAGAKLSGADFPPQNQGMGLPDTLGLGGKKIYLEAYWWTDITRLTQILDEKYSISQIQQVPMEMKAKWVRDMIRGYYTTALRGDMVLKLFRGTSPADRPELYRLVEGHAWSGDWREGIAVRDDDLVDELYRSQLNKLRDLINGKQ